MASRSSSYVELRYGALLATLVAVMFGCEPPRARSPGNDEVQSRPSASPADVRFSPQVGHSAVVRAIAASSDGRFALSAGHDGSIKQWDLGSKKLVRTMSRVDSIVNAVAISPEGASAVSGGIDGMLVLREILARQGARAAATHAENHFVLTVWDLAKARPRGKLLGHRGEILAVAFSGDGKRVASAALDRTARVWDVASGREIVSFAHPLASRGVAFAADGKTLVTACDDGNLRVWDLAQPKEAARVLAGHAGVVTGVALSEDGRSAASGGQDGTLRLWDLASGQSRSVKAHDGGVGAVAFKAGVVVSGGARQGLRLWDFATGQGRALDAAGVTAVAIAGSSVLGAGADLAVRVWDAKSGTQVAAFAGQSEQLSGIAVSEGGRFVASDAQGLSLWDLATMHRARRVVTAGVAFVAISADGKRLVTSGASGTQLWDAELGRLIADLAKPERAGPVGFSPDGRIAIGPLRSDAVGVWDGSKGTKIAAFGDAAEHTAHAFLADGSAVVSGASDGTLRIWNPKTGELVASRSERGAPVIAIGFVRDARRVQWLSGTRESSVLASWEPAQRRIERVASLQREVTSARFSPDARLLLVGTEDGPITVWEASTGTLLRKLEGHTDGVSGIAFLPGTSLAVSGSTDGLVKLWNVETRVAATMLGAGSEWLIYTDDGYFDASRNGADLVAMVRGDEVFAVDQFAIRNNRPDVILKRFGIGKPDVVAHFEGRFKKRLRRAGIQGDDLPADLHVPEAKILSARAQGVPGAPGKMLELSLELKDAHAPLLRYNVFVNGVPVFGGFGKEISGSEKTLSETIELTPGTNTVEVSAINARGSESYRAQRVFTYEGKERGDLYFVGFGVSKYKDSRLDLEYAHKDALDIARFLEGARASYGKVVAKTFVNEEVTADAVTAARALLAAATPQDTVVLFIAGHGVHARDRDATYYYLTYGASAQNLAGTALAFEDIEALLSGISARKKLFLMDTCQSGEVYDDAEAPSLAGAEKRGVRSRAVRALVLEADETTPKPSAPPRRSFLLQRDRFLYNDLTRRSGAIVFASSQGSESSYEADGNGFFTKEILAALSTRAADRDGNGWLGTSELRDYVSAAVARRSGGLQNPTIDRDNPRQRIELPLR